MSWTERQSQTCEPMTDVEKHFDAARRDLQNLVTSACLQNFNTSSLGKLSSQESIVFVELWRRKRFVAELRRRLASLRRLISKVISKRLPNSLRDGESQQVEDQSRWGDIVHDIASDTPKLSLQPGCATTFRPTFYASQFCPASRLLVLHLRRVVTWWSSLDSDRVSVHRDGCSAGSSLASAASPFDASSVSPHVALFCDQNCVVDFGAGSGTTSSHCSSRSLQGSWHSWGRTCVISLSWIAPLRCSTPLRLASLSHLALRRDSPVVDLPGPSWLAGFTFTAQDPECTERSC